MKTGRPGIHMNRRYGASQAQYLLLHWVITILMVIVISFRYDKDRDLCYPLFQGRDREKFLAEAA
jgi:hypothetical protein